MIQLRGIVTRWFRWIATLAWALVLVGFFYRRQDVGAAGLAILLAACWGLEGDRYPPTYVRFIKWTCSIALLAYAVVLAFNVTGH